MSYRVTVTVSGEHGSMSDVHVLEHRPAAHELHALRRAATQLFRESGWPTIKSVDAVIEPLLPDDDELVAELEAALQEEDGWRE